MRRRRALSHAVLKARVGVREIGISTAPNTLVVFEGALVSHQVTPILEGERRVILSMTYCTDPRAYWWLAVPRRLNAKWTQQAGHFALRQLAWRPFIVQAAPFVPEIVFRSEMIA